MRFHLVDRITAIDPGRGARGRLALPATGSSPSWIAEAVGQLAAWVAMADSGFRRRPVAGMTRVARISGDARAGATLDLEVALDGCDDDAVCYSGSARQGGVAVLELADCVGPMLPLEEFDAPAAVADRFQRLCGNGLGPDERATFVTLPFERRDSFRGTVDAPTEPSFFVDHFPRKPVLPATLLLDAGLRLAASAAAEEFALAAEECHHPRVVEDLKLRSFVSPGERVDLWVEVSGTRARPEVRLSASVASRRVASARAELVLVAGT
jgi:3-hydroxymyristoyl/3-hydroxydecanoyl-(acyl carrier protein) dehydratase